jgi:hypothetical protein
MRVEHILAYFARWGVLFSRNGEKLDVKPTRGPLAKNEIEIFRDRKAEILTALDTIDELAKRGIPRDVALGCKDFGARICPCGSWWGFEVPDGLLCSNCEKLNPPWAKRTKVVRSFIPGMQEEMQRARKSQNAQ